MISDKYADFVASNWHTAFSTSVWIAIACIILFIITTILTNGKMKHWLPVTCEVFIFSLMLCSWLFWFNSWNSDANTALIRSPRSMRTVDTSYIFDTSSPYTIPHTTHIVRHNQEMLPQDWKHDEFLLHHVGKRPSRDHVMRFRSYTLRKNKQLKYQKELIHKEHFDNYNKKYCTKKYVKLPTLVDYL